MNELHFFLCPIKKEEAEFLFSEKRQDDRGKVCECAFLCVCMCARRLMHDDWEILYSTKSIVSVHHRSEMGSRHRKDLHGRRVGERVEEFAPEHRRSCVGIYSKRISHLIKTSAQLPGGLCYTKQLHVIFRGAPHLNFFFLLHTEKKKNGKHVIFSERNPTIGLVSYFAGLPLRARPLVDSVPLEQRAHDWINI